MVICSSFSVAVTLKEAELVKEIGICAWFKFSSMDEVIAGILTTCDVVRFIAVAMLGEATKMIAIL